MNRRRRWWLAGAAGVVAAVSLLMFPPSEMVRSQEVGVLHLRDGLGWRQIPFRPLRRW